MRLLSESHAWVQLDELRPRREGLRNTGSAPAFNNRQPKHTRTVQFVSDLSIKMLLVGMESSNCS